MPASSVREFTDPDDYSSSFRDFQYELNVTVGGGFAAEHVRVDLHELRLQHYSSNLPWVAHTAIPDGRAVFALRAEPGPSLLRAGKEDRDDQHRAACPRANDLYPFIGRGVVGDDLAFPGCTGCDRRNDSRSRIRDARGRDDANARVGNDGAAQAALRSRRAPRQDGAGYARSPRSRAFTRARPYPGVGRLYRTRSERGGRLAKRRHAAIMRRFQALVAASCDRPVYTTDMCAAIGVSDRTLEICCREHLGISPQKYLRLRRMQRVRRALALADPRSGTVTGIATAHGFWELGRFAGVYRSFYGESPSQTLSADPAKFSESA